MEPQTPEARASVDRLNHLAILHRDLVERGVLPPEIWGLEASVPPENRYRGGFANLESEATARDGIRRGHATTSFVTQPAEGGDPAKALRQLNRLRKDGLISEGEYTTKRLEIIARL